MDVQSGNPEMTDVECRFCHRQRDPEVLCRNTRDMDPIDGLWDDAWCHVALHNLGGGERGFRLPVADAYVSAALSPSLKEQERT